MILTKYIVNKIFKNQMYVLLVLFFIFFSQKFIRTFDIVVDSNISKFLVFVFFTLSIPEILKLILPVSLFFGILITFNYFHINNEIIAMYSCGLGNNFLIRIIFFLSIITTTISVINIIYVSPLCSRYQNYLIFQYRSNFGEIKLFEKKFHVLKHINSVFFFDSFCKKKIQDIFLVQIIPNGVYSIVVASNGCIKKSYDGSRWMILGSGNSYSWNKNFDFHSNFYVSSFDQYRIFIDSEVHVYKNYNLVMEMSIFQLWSSSMLDARAELHWRLTLILVSFIMAMIIFPLSLIRLNNNYLLSVFPAIILYFVFFLLQIFIRFNVFRGNIEPLWVWLVNVVYILIAVVLNFWESVIFRNLRWKFRFIKK